MLLAVAATLFSLFVIPSASESLSIPVAHAHTLSPRLRDGKRLRHNIRHSRRFIRLTPAFLAKSRKPRPLRSLLCSSSLPNVVQQSHSTETIATRTEVSSEKPPLQRSLIGLACLLFVIGAALAAAETAITTLWPWKVRELAEKEGRKSPFAVLESDLTRFLTTILVSTTTATVFATAIATELAGEVFGAAAVGYVTAALTVFFLFFGEILPKALAVHAPAKVARIMVPVIKSLSVIVYPLGKLLATMSTYILRLLKLPMESDANVSEEELRLIVAGADRSGSIEKHESEIIRNVLDLEETDVSDVMCPRVDMVALPLTSTLTKLLELESQSHYSRMPVFDGTVDNIVGVALAKSLLNYLNEDPALLRSVKISEIMDPPFFVPESMSVWVALEEMRRRRLHMAVVVDEYGGTAGLVTLEDILEEVVGEIYDEDDDYEAEAQFIERISEGFYIVDGQADLDKVGEALALSLSEDDLNDYGTISGFLCAQMGGIPEIGDSILLNSVKFTVAEADDRRIIRVGAEVLSDNVLAEMHEDNVSTANNTDALKGNGLSRTLDSNIAPSRGSEGMHRKEDGDASFRNIDGPREGHIPQAKHGDSSETDDTRDPTPSDNTGAAPETNE